MTGTSSSPSRTTPTMLWWLLLLACACSLLSCDVHSQQQALHSLQGTHHVACWGGQTSQKLLSLPSLLLGVSVEVTSVGRSRRSSLHAFLEARRARRISHGLTLSIEGRRGQGGHEGRERAVERKDSSKKESNLLQNGPNSQDSGKDPMLLLPLEGKSDSSSSSSSSSDEATGASGDAGNLQHDDKETSQNDPAPLDPSPLEGGNGGQELGFDADLASLQVLDLGLFQDKFATSSAVARSAEQELSALHLACSGGICPDFQACPVGGADERRGPLISACSNEHLEDRELTARFEKKSFKPDWYTVLEPCPENSEAWSTNDVISPRCPNPNIWLGRKEVPPESFKGNDEWSGQVLVLRNVFVTWDGLVFNRTHLFSAGGCPLQEGRSFPSSSKVIRKAAAVNLLQPLSIPRFLEKDLSATTTSPEAGSNPTLHDDANDAATSKPHAPAVHHLLIGQLPLFLSLAPLLPRLKRSRAAFLADSKFLRLVSRSLLGIDVASPAARLQSPDHLLLVDTLLQPFRQSCMHPSPSLWLSLRRLHLLPPDGLPIFNSNDWTYRQPPPGSLIEMGPSVGEGWRVAVLLDETHRVVLRHRERPERAEESVGDVVGREFGEERVVPFVNDLNLDDARAFFKQVSFFVTVNGAGLFNLVFMPPNSTVLDLRPNRTKSPADAAASSQKLLQDIVLERNFADACGIRLFVLICDQDDNLLSVCDAESVKDVVDKTVRPVFLSPAARANAEAKVGASFSSSFPGTKLGSAAEVEGFREWMRCVGAEGKWVYDPLPRILPWGWERESSMCDETHVEEGGISGENANDLVRQGLPAEDWKVREELKYLWRVPPGKCPFQGEEESWQEFDPKTFCEKFGGMKVTILFVGDSLSQHAFSTLLFHILMHQPEPKEAHFVETALPTCEDYLRDKFLERRNCREIKFSGDVCPGVTIRYLRDDLLWLDRSWDPGNEFPWARHAVISDADVVILNRGAHYISEEDFDESVAEAMTFLRNRYPEKLLIFRNTPPGQANCQNYSGPMDRRQDLRELQTGEWAGYHWDTFEDQNRRLNSFSLQHGIIVMDVDTMTALRPDGHIAHRNPTGRVDCLHYCTPGPQDVWVQLLYNIMFKVLPF